MSLLTLPLLSIELFEFACRKIHLTVNALSYVIQLYIQKFNYSNNNYFLRKMLKRLFSMNPTQILLYELIEFIYSNYHFRKIIFEKFFIKKIKETFSSSPLYFTMFSFNDEEFKTFGYTKLREFYKVANQPHYIEMSVPSKGTIILKVCDSYTLENLYNITVPFQNENELLDYVIVYLNIYYKYPNDNNILEIIKEQISFVNLLTRLLTSKFNFSIIKYIIENYFQYNQENKTLETKDSKESISIDQLLNISKHPKFHCYIFDLLKIKMDNSKFIELIDGMMITKEYKTDPYVKVLVYYMNQNNFRLEDFKSANPLLQMYLQEARKFPKEKLPLYVSNIEFKKRYDRIHNMYIIYISDDVLSFGLAQCIMDFVDVSSWFDSELFKRYPKYFLNPEN